MCKTSGTLKKALYVQVAQKVVKEHDANAVFEQLARAKEEVLLKDGGSEAEAQKEAENFKKTLINREAFEKAEIGELFTTLLAKCGEDFWGDRDERVEGLYAFAGSAHTVYSKLRSAFLGKEVKTEFRKTRVEIFKSTEESMRDVALFYAVTRRQKNALKIFREKYEEEAFGIISALAKRYGRAFLTKEEKERICRSFYGKLWVDGPTMALYSGRCALKSYLYLKLWDYMNTYFDLKNKKTISLDDCKLHSKKVFAKGSSSEDEVDKVDARLDLDPKIREALGKMLENMTPLRRRICLLGLNAKVNNDETMESCAQKYQIPINSFRYHFREAMLSLKNVFNDYDKETRNDLQERMCQNGRELLREALRRIDPNTGDLLN